MAVVSGTVVAEEEITGVLTRIPCVFETDLVDIVAEDRPYAAAEMTAFLSFWLSQLKCRVLNRPTPTCLSGPYFRKEQWVHFATQAGIASRPVARRAVLRDRNPNESFPSETVITTVTIVGDRWFGKADQTLASQARKLADLARIDLLAVQFSSDEPGAQFVNAEIFPDLSAEGVADAVFDHLASNKANMRRHV